MKSVIITKWIEPYRLLETIKQFYTYQDFTFNGQNKAEQKDKFFKALKSNKFSVGLYMKNVNKFYLFTRENDFDIAAKLIEVFHFCEQDYIETHDIDKPFDMVDLGQAEAGLIF